ncbi:MAG: hypothetical protein M0Q24_03480 [Sulfurimonas sp.]|uniref:hypothetical protein n=1 Tax=Sulfurimonas sp. TaxID=2022749 RepID=UPI0025EB8915|nr:hypothetical protein [Sulfurimonas sp.]MCK9491129.1 hypothetical protein [Sulfurimonas sp.]
MRSRVLIPSVAFLLIFLMALYFLINPSYEKSLKAKYYYEIGEYKEALVFAKEAFSMDIYNRMASTVMAQSITSLKYVSYNEDARAYMQDINKIATHEVISNADRAKIRTICEIMLSAYKKLAPSVVTDEKLVSQAAKYHKDFEKLLEKVSK